MARVNGIFKVTGSLQNVSFYTMKGSDKVYMRTKGGPSARRLKKGPEFELVRRHQSEWKGCVLFSRYLCSCMDSIYRMRDYNVSPVINGIAKQLMKEDTVNEVGQRSILLSKAREVFEGFNLNKQFPFNTVFRTSLYVEVDRIAGKMKVSIPRILTANDLYNVQKLPFFRLKFNLSYISDMYHTPNDSYKCFEETTAQYGFLREESTTEWFSTSDVIPAQQIETNLEISRTEAELQHITFLAMAGIEFGTTVAGGAIEPVKHACCAKILKAC